MDPDRLMRNLTQSMGMGVPFDPIGNLFGGPPVHRNDSNHQRANHMSPFGSMMPHAGNFMNPMSLMLMNPMSMIMMDPFQSMQQSMSLNGNNMGGVSYCSSSVTTFTTDEHGRPQIIQRANEIKQGPNGLKETKSSLRDSRTGQQELAIGHHLREKAHIKKKSKNVYTGEEEQTEELVNLDEEETNTFEQTWMEQARNASAYNHRGHGSRALGGNRLALTSGAHNDDRYPQPPTPATSRNHSSSASASASSSSLKNPVHLASKLFKKEKKKKKSSSSLGNSEKERRK